MGKTAIKICDWICIKHQWRKVLKVGGPLRKIEDFIAKIEFLWRALKFKRGHGPLGLLFSATYGKKGLIHAIINTEKSRFEILITVYLKNAWCLVYAIPHQSIMIQFSWCYLQWLAS